MRRARAVLGAGPAAEAFFLALRVPGFVGRLFAALLTLPLQAQAQTVGTLVSNTRKTVHNLDLQMGVSGSNKWSLALGFTAGDNEAVTATLGSMTSLNVSWTAPENTGRPRITSYDLQYTVQICR